MRTEQEPGGGKTREHHSPRIRVSSGHCMPIRYVCVKVPLPLSGPVRPGTW